MEILRKMTIKTCGNFTIARIKEVLQAAAGFTEETKDGKTVQKPKDIPDGLTVDLLKIAGECTRAQTGSTDKGVFTKLMGQMIGTDMTTGTLYQSGVCILPEFIGSQIGAAILSSDGHAVEFGFMISARAKGNSVTGYEFAVKSLIEPKPTATQQRMLALLGTAPASPALAAPAAPAAEAAAPAAPAAEAAAPAAPATQKSKTK